MGEHTHISWCDHTWSPWYGCTQISLGKVGACVACYARQLSETRFQRVIFGGPGRGEGTRDVRADAAWSEPVRWNRTDPGSFIFPSMCDPFDNHPDLHEPRRRFFDLIRATPKLIWLPLTKRPGNIARLFAETITPEVRKAHQRIDLLGRSLWPRNAAICFTAVTQEEFDRDWPKAKAAFLAFDAPFVAVSCEPMLGEIILPPDFLELAGRAWVIAGGETSQGALEARPAHPDWFRSLRDQCAAAGVPFHFKQWGSWAPMDAAEIVQDGPVSHMNGHVPDWMDRGVTFRDGSVRRVRGHSFTAHGTDLVYLVGPKHAGRLLDGVVHDARPEIEALAA